jgi:DNA-binding XRE family transcriptional regulator
MDRQTTIIVKQTRKQLGLTQKKMAALLGISRDCIASYETGRSDPPGGIMLKILDLGKTTIQSHEIAA